MKICTIQDGQKMLREVNPYDKQFQWNAWQAFERYVQHHMQPCDIPDLNEGDTIEDSECELVWQWENNPNEWITEIDPFNHLTSIAHTIPTRQAYVRKEPVRGDDRSAWLHSRVDQEHMMEDIVQFIQRHHYIRSEELINILLDKYTVAMNKDTP